MTAPVPALVRVGIVSWNAAGALDDCLAALPAALDGMPAEVVVVDNASVDDSARVARNHGVTVIENSGNRGYARAMNQALLTPVEGPAPAPFLLALNPDTVCGPGTLRKLADHLAAREEVGVVAPRLLDREGNHQHSVYRFPRPLIPVAGALSTERIRRSAFGRNLLLQGCGRHDAGVVDWAIGAVHLIRRSALAGEDPYPEESFMYGEDLDLCWRLADRGTPTLLVDDVSIVHIGNVSGAQAWGNRRAVPYWTETYRTIARRRSGAAARRNAAGVSIAAAIAIGRALPRTVLRRSRTPAMREIDARLGALRLHLTTLVRGPR